MQNKKKQIMIFSGVVISILLIVIFGLLVNKKTNKKQDQKLIPTEITIPTIDSSVKVELTQKVVGKEVLLKVGSIPSGTESIEYSLSYETSAQGLQGVIGTITINSNRSDYEKEITLGTCSSGKCVYHEVKGAIKLNLKFNGNYGEKIFEKDFTL